MDERATATAPTAPADTPQAVLVILADTTTLRALMLTTQFGALMAAGRTMYATPATGDAIQVTGDTMVATLTIAAKPAA